MVGTGVYRKRFHRSLRRALVLGVWTSGPIVVTPADATILMGAGVTAESGSIAVAPAAASLTMGAGIDAAEAGSVTVSPTAAALSVAALVDSVSLGSLSITASGSLSMQADIGDVIVPSGIVETVNTSATTLIAGQTFFLDFVGTTSSQTSKPYHHIYYLVDWGDSGNPDNTMKGPVGAHVYRDPGTYFASYELRDRHGNYTTGQVEITVQDPDTVYSGTDTICVSTDGVWTGEKTGCTRVQTSNWATVLSYVARGKRVLCKRGQTWTASAEGSLNLSTGSGTAILDVWGSGAKPIVQASTTFYSYVHLSAGDYFVLGPFRFEYTGAAHDTDMHSFSVDNTCSYVSCYDGESDALTHPMPSFSSDGPRLVYSTPDSNHMACHGWTSTNTQGNWFACYGSGDYYAYVGCSFDWSDTSTVQNHMRFPGGSYFYLAYNQYGGTAAGSGQTKLHGTPHVDSSTDSRYWNFHDEDFNDQEPPWPNGVGPQNTTTDERIYDVIIDGRYHNLTTEVTVGQVIAGGNQVTVRNCIYDFRNRAGYGIAMQAGGFGIAPDVSGFEMYHCVAWGSASGGSSITRLVEQATFTDTPIIKNCIVWNPAATTVEVTDGTVTDGGNVIIDPLFTDPANQDFSLGALSPALDNGVTVDVINSYNDGDLRNLNGNTPDSGAYEESTGDLSVTPTAASITLGADASTLAAGDTSVEPLPATITPQTQVGSVNLGSMSASPSAATVTMGAIIDEVVGGGISATPAPGSITMGASASIATGSLSLSPAVATLTMGAENPTVLSSTPVRLTTVDVTGRLYSSIPLRGVL